MCQNRRKWCVRPVFEDCGGFVVVLRRGCGVIRGSKYIISDIEYRLIWYL